MEVSFVDIDKNLPGGANMGGIKQTVYFAYHKDVASWPTEPDFDSVTDIEELATLTGEITMKSGTRFFKLYLTDDTGEFEIESVGEKDGKSWIMHLRLFHPGLQKKILGFINAAKNENLVFIVPDNNQNLFLMGDALRPATYEGSPDSNGTGMETSARPGVSMEFTYKTSNLYQYGGSVPLTETT
ncbi:hypothetical protein ACT29H_09360 [Thermophagus sp. OGC60D27]|uniref:hypothetical protein n=1 Tax=Thermophagus sp. OGC60D27 TaxID=3458415 RepID=UPI00403786E4